MPVQKLPMARVTMKGDRPVRMISSPLMRPHPAPIPKARAIAIGVGTSNFSISPPTAIVTRPPMAPTDRSRPPDPMTIICARPTKAAMEKLRART